MRFINSCLKSPRFLCSTMGMRTRFLLSVAWSLKQWQALMLLWYYNGINRMVLVNYRIYFEFNSTLRFAGNYVLPIIHKWSACRGSQGYVKRNLRPYAWDDGSIGNAPTKSMSNVAFNSIIDAHSRASIDLLFILVFHFFCQCCEM